MTVSVVDVLEMVNIDKDEAEWLVRALRTPDLVCNRLVHFAAVWKPGEFVCLRNAFELLVRQFQILSAFADFLFKDFPMGVQFLDLPLDSAVHGVERDAQLT